MYRLLAHFLCMLPKFVNTCCDKQVDTLLLLALGKNLLIIWIQNTEKGMWKSINRIPVIVNFCILMNFKTIVSQFSRYSGSYKNIIEFKICRDLIDHFQNLLSFKEKFKMKDVEKKTLLYICYKTRISKLFTDNFTRLLPGT